MGITSHRRHDLPQSDALMAISKVNRAIRFRKSNASEAKVAGSVCDFDHGGILLGDTVHLVNGAVDLDQSNGLLPR